MKKRVFVMGKGTLAIRIADWFLNCPNHVLAGVVPVVPEPIWTASLSDWARRQGVWVVESGDYRDINLSICTGT